MLIGSFSKHVSELCRFINEFQSLLLLEAYMNKMGPTMKSVFWLFHDGKPWYSRPPGIHTPRAPAPCSSLVNPRRIQPLRIWEWPRANGLEPRSLLTDKNLCPFQSEFYKLGALIVTISLFNETKELSENTKTVAQKPNETSYNKCLTLRQQTWVLSLSSDKKLVSFSVQNFTSWERCFYFSSMKQ